MPVLAGWGMLLPPVRPATAGCASFLPAARPASGASDNIGPTRPGLVMAGRVDIICPTAGAWANRYSIFPAAAIIGNLTPAYPTTGAFTPPVRRRQLRNSSNRLISPPPAKVCAFAGYCRRCRCNR